MIADPADLGLMDAAEMIAARQVSPIDLTAGLLDRIQRMNERLHAFVTVTPEAAMEAACEAEREIAGGLYRGPLHGIPVAIKDLIAVKDVSMTAGSRALENHRSKRDAAVVTRLREAGAILVGTTSLDEFAFATLGGPAVNPVDENRAAGGSSGGSAVAVAARMCSGSLGTDTGGSVRIPAACCGIVGVKPTYGTIDMTGIMPLAWSIDHVGAFGRTVADAGALAETMLRAPSHRIAGGCSGLRIGVADEHFLRVAGTDVRAAFENAVVTLADLGAVISTIGLPDSDLALNVQYLIVLPEAASYHRSAHAERLHMYGDEVRAALEWGDGVSARDYIDAQRVRSSMRDTVDALLESVDCIALPTMPLNPPTLGQTDVVLGDGRREDVVSAMLRYTCLFNHTGHPAVSLPCPGPSDGMALQMVGRRFSEAMLLDAAAHFEEAAYPSS